MDVKKLIGLGIAAASLSTFATGIESANVVGYTTSTLEAGKYNMISIPFVSVNCGNSKLTEVLSGSNWFGHDDMNQADNILVYNPETTEYTTYYWWEDDSHLYDGWYHQDGQTFFDDRIENADGIEPGWSVWYRSRGANAPVVTFSGAVDDSDDCKVTIYGGCYNMIANPYPTAFQPNADQPWWSNNSFKKLVDWNGPVANDDMNQADNILVWVPTTGEYITYYYWEDSSHLYDGWYYQNGINFFEDDPDHPEMTNGLPAGSVFWYRSRAEKGNNRTITFFNPTK